jgi:hypothetical protein
MRRPWQGKRSLAVSGLRRRRSLVRPRSNSKAVGDDQTGGFALSPYVPFRDGIVGLSKLGSEVAAVSPASHPSAQRGGGRPNPDRGSLPPCLGPHRCVANIVSEELHWPTGGYGQRPSRTDDCLTTVDQT